MEPESPAGGVAVRVEATVGHDDDDWCDDDEPPCLICGGKGWVVGSDHLDWDEDGYDDIIRCTSCKGSGLAKDMTWC